MAFRNARIVLPDRVTPPRTVLVQKGRISQMGEGLPAGADRLPAIDAHGRYLGPGLIDIHCHGDGDRWIFGPTEEVLAHLLKNGTTGVLATLGYTDMEPGRLHQQVGAFWNSLRPPLAAAVLGVHLEGPYLNSKYGANQRLRKVHPPLRSEYQPVLDQWSHVVRLWTMAPELEGIAEFAEAASSRGIILSAGHTEAGADLAESLLTRGLRIATHWSNATATPPTRFKGTKEPGIDELALVDDRLWAEVVPDSNGFHVRPLMLRLLHRAKGPDRIILISDGSQRRPGSPPVSPGADVNFSPEGELAGSRLCLLDAARNFHRHVGCGLPEIFRMGSLNAARLFGWAADLGSVEVGKLANLVLIDDDFKLHGAWLHGRQVGP